MEPWAAGLSGVVTLPSGRLVRGRGLRSGPVYDADAPDFGLYLTARLHQEGWQSQWIAWPDFRLPRVPAEALAALREAYDRCLAERVEIACGGGTGRTGTALAILARYDGVPADEAVAWVRAAYRRNAVETPWQRRFVREAQLSLRPINDRLREENGVVMTRVDEELRALEPITHRLPAGADRAAIEALLEENFFEVGASGKVYPRDVVLDVVAQRYSRGEDPDDDAWSIDDFSTVALIDNVYLVTYRLRFAGRLSRRSTLWRRHQSGWCAVYHQGTPCEPEPAA